MAFANDEDLEIEFVSKESMVQEKQPRPQNEIIIDSAIDPIHDDDAGTISQMRKNPAATRHEAMVNELTGFAKESPETIAAIIKNWFREDN